MKIFLLFSLCLCFFFFISCASDKEDEKLNYIENLIKTQPDLALSLLDSIRINPSNLLNQNKFFLLRTYAKDLTHQDISLENEIFEVYDYFLRKDEHLAGLAAYYSGRVLQENKNYGDAITYYNLAESNALKMNNKNFQGIVLYSIGDLLLQQFMVKEAKVKLAQANSLFSITNNYEYEIKSYKLLGTYYLLSDSIDAAINNLDSALFLSYKHNNIKEQALITQNIGVAFNEKGEFYKAIRVLSRAIQIDTIVHKSGKVYLNLAEAYKNTNQIDSAQYYANYCLTIAKNDFAVAATAYEILSELDVDNHNYKDALLKHKKYSENLTMLLTDNKNRAIINSESKYKFEVMKNENMHLSLQQLKTQSLLIIALFIIAVLTIIYYKSLLNKNKQLNQANDEILSLTEDSSELVKLLKSHDSTRELYKDNLLHNLNILKRATSLEFFVKDSDSQQGKRLIKRFNEIAYGQENIDWNILYQTINSLNNELFDKLKIDYSNLDDTEFKICCLIYCKFTSNEISVITQLSVNTVHMKTTNIRKKLRIEKYGNIIDFFTKKYSL